MDRLSPEDAMFLAVEDDCNPMHIGTVSVFEGPAPGYGDLIRTVASHLDRLPRYRQRIRFVPLGLGRPVWVDDPHFQILYHVRHTATPPPGSAEELRNLAGRVFAQNLDRGKPLWELWMVEGLENGRWALISKVHHCMVDGVAATDLLTVLLDREPQARARRAPVWHPDRQPSHLHMLGDALRDALMNPLNPVRAIPAVAHGIRRIGLSGIAMSMNNLTDVADFLGSLGSWTQRPAGSLNGPIGPHRRWSWAQVSLDDVREVRTAFGATVNDVVLAAITKGFRDLMRRRGENVTGKVVRSLVPVSVRRDNERGTYNNRVSVLFPSLPVGVAQPVARLTAIKQQMDRFKRSGQAVAGDVLVQLSGFAPPMLLAVSLRLAWHAQQRLVQTVTTNVPGPQFPLYAVGRQMLYAYPHVPIAGSVRIGVAVFSYLGVLNFGVTGDYDSVPDIDVLTRGIQSGTAELLAAARHADRPQPRSTRRAESAAG